MESILQLAQLPQASEGNQVSDTRRCKCGCRATDDKTEGFWHGCWWFGSKACYDAYAGRCHGKRGAIIEQPDDEEATTETIYARAHALEGTDRHRVESLRRKYTPFNDHPASERAMRLVVDGEARQ